MERHTLTVEEAATMLGIGRNSAYELIRQAKIPSIRLGKRVVVPRVALLKMLDMQGGCAIGDPNQEYTNNE